MKVLGILGLTLLLLQCSAERIEKAAKALSPMYPQQEAVHLVEFYKIQVGARDFNLSTFGNPLDLEVSLYADGNKIRSTSILGTRGERNFRNPKSWLVPFYPTKNYQLKVSEQSIIADATVWSIPGTPRIGYWPIAENNGAISFGTESILYFRDTVLEERQSDQIQDDIEALMSFLPVVGRAAQKYRGEQGRRPKSLDELVQIGYLRPDKDLAKRWKFVFWSSSVDARSLFVDINKKQIVYGYDYKSKKVEEVGDRVVFGNME